MQMSKLESVGNLCSTAALSNMKNTDLLPDYFGVNYIMWGLTVLETLFKVTKKKKNTFS